MSKKVRAVEALTLAHAKEILQLQSLLQKSEEVINNPEASELTKGKARYYRDLAKVRLAFLE